MLFFLIACNDGTLTTKNVNANPEATIILPDSNDGGDVEDGTTILFRAVVSDADPDDQLSLEARWRIDSNADAACEYAAPDENGETSCEIAIEVGMEKIIVEVRDPQNGVGSDEYLLNVIETVPPEIELLSPTIENLYKEGVAISFEAIVSDTEDEPEELLVTWETDLAGSLELEGIVSSFGLYESEGMLLEGTHLVTATVIDTNGKSASDSVEIVVGPAIQPLIEYVDIKSTTGTSLDEAYNGQTILCGASASHPEDAPLTWTYTWNNDAGTDITVDSMNNNLVVNFSTQGLAVGESITCTATVSDGQASVSDSDSVILVDCSPFATEIPYDGIDSNCDGLEYLNDADRDGQPDDPNVNFNMDDPTAQARLGVECLGEAMATSNGTVYFLLCDDDHYWKESHDFCADNGYDSLATFQSDAEFQFASTLLTSSRNDYQYPDGSNRDSSIWTGFTRGPDCDPVESTNMPYNSVCSSGISNYYWIDNSDTSWLNTSHWIAGEGSNAVEHCAMLLLHNSGQIGLYDLYCDYVDSSPHDAWSITHSRPSMCVKRQ